MWVNSDECARKEKGIRHGRTVERTKRDLTQKGLLGEQALDMDYLDATSLKHRHHTSRKSWRRRMKIHNVQRFFCEVLFSLQVIRGVICADHGKFPIRSPLHDRVILIQSLNMVASCSVRPSVPGYIT